MPRATARCLLLAPVIVSGLAVSGLAQRPIDTEPPPDGAERAFAGGETVALRGLATEAGTTTNLGFINLEAAQNRCTLALADLQGAALVPAIAFTLRAGEERPFLDVFGRQSTDKSLVAAGSTEAQAAISCAGSFDAFALLSDTATGQLDLVAAERGGERSDLLASAKALDPCATGADCFDAVGTVHVPEAAKPVGRVSFPAAAGQVKRFRVSMDVTVGEWFPEQPSGKHLIFWFVIDRNFFMPGLLYFRGPGKYEAFARHGVGLTHPQKIKVIKKWKAEVGRTYHVVNDYDMAANRYTVTISDAQTGKVEVTLQSRPNVASFVVKAGSKYILDMGFPFDVVPTEVPSYGWRYKELHVEAYRK